MADRNEYLEDPMWYVVHTYSGYENKVKANIDKSIQNLHLEDQILDVQVPVQSVVEVKDGKKKTVQKKLFPGYVLLHMIMNDETWYVVRNTRGVTGFVGPESKPVPLTQTEMENMGIVVDGAQAENADPVMEVLVDIEEGDIVTVVSGAWENREGIVKAVNTARSTVTIGIDVFGRETAVEISFLDIRKM
jgi:transcriptional antiterminator NusG